jgi:hypothetical protein
MTQTLENKHDALLSEWELQQAKNARHRALIMQILTAYPDGLTIQQIVSKEQETFGYTFLTDNRARELRELGWAESFGEKPQKWRIKNASGKSETE